MANYMEQAFAPAEAKYREDVKRATWGHLAPQKNKVYKGHIVFAVGCYGDDPLNPVVLACSFKDRQGQELTDSPWFFDSLSDFVGEFVGLDNQNAFGIEQPEPLHPCQAGGVYRWEGTFRNYLFRGDLRQLYSVWI